MTRIFKIISGAAGFFIFVTSACASPDAANPWVLKRDLEGIKVYSRKRTGSPILEFRSEMTVHYPIEKVVELFEQDHRMPEWFHRCGQAELVEKISPNEKRVYFMADLVFPFLDRDGVYRSVKSLDPEKKAVIYTIFPDNRDYPKRRGRVRIQELDTEWRFTPLEDGRTRVEYRQHSGAGGFVPPALVNLFTVSIPFKTFRKFRALLDFEFRDTSLQNPAITAEDTLGLAGVSGAVPARGDRSRAGGRAKRVPVTTGQ